MRADQTESLYNYFKENNFSKLIKTHDCLSKNDQVIFASSILRILKVKFLSTYDQVKGSYKDPKTLSQTERSNCTNVPVWNTNISSTCSDNSIAFDPMEPVSELWDNLFGGCHDLAASYNESEGKIYFFTKAKSIGNIITWKNNGNPCEDWVNVHFETDFNYAGIKAGTTITVPLFYLYHLIKQHDAILHGQAFRVALDAVSIAGAVFTGGGSLSILAITEVTVAGGDILITLNEDRISARPEGLKFIEYYNKFQLILGGVQLVRGLGNALNISLKESKLASLTTDKFSELKSSISAMLNESKAWGSIVDNVRLATFNTYFNYQILIADLSRTWLPAANNSIRASLGQVFLKPAGFSSEIENIAQGVFLNKGFTYNFTKNKTAWIYNETQIKAVIDAPDKYKRIGTLENIHYNSPDDIAGTGDVQFYYEVGSSKIVAFKASLSNGIWLAAHPNIRSVLNKVNPILNSAGFDRYRFENILRESDNLKYLEENASLLPEIATKIKPALQYSDADILKIFKDAVNTDFVKKLLPDNFVNSLKTFGKTEDEIVAYFRNYHNVNTKGEFFTQIEKVILNSNPFALSKDEAYAVWGYTTNFYYRDLNEWLRTGTNTEKTLEITNLLKQGIQKLPKYNGIAYRALEFKGEALTNFIKKIGKKGDEIVFDDFLSAGSTKDAAFFNKLEKNVRLTMEVKDAPIISSVADGIKFRGYSPEELLLNTGKKFVITEVKLLPNRIYEIKMVQIN